MSGYTNDKFGYLPPELNNRFIKAGHNKYAPPKRETPLKDAKVALRKARKGKSDATVADAKAAFQGAKRERFVERTRAGAAKSQAKLNKRAEKRAAKRKTMTGVGGY